MDVYYGRWESLAFHHVLLLLGLTESDMPGTRLLVETPAADMAFDYANIFGLVEHPLFLFGRFIVIISRLFDSCPQLQRLSFPFGQLLLSLLLLKFLLYHLALLHQFFLFLDNKALILCIELFSFLLEDLLADSFVLGDAVGVETTSAAHSALLQLRRVVFLYLNSVLTIHLFYRLLLVLLISSSIAGLVTRLAVFLPGGLLALALLWWLVLFLLVLVLRFLWGRLVVFWLLIPSPIVTSFIVASLIVASLFIASFFIASLIVTSFIVASLLIASLIVAWLVVVVLCLVAGLPSGLLRGVVLVVYIFVGLADWTTLTSLLVVVAVVILKIYVVREILREFTGWRWAALEE